MQETTPLIMTPITQDSVQTGAPNAAQITALSTKGNLLQTRLIAGVLFAASMGLLLLSLWLHPSDGGVGTHEQLGLPACGLLEATGVPCATCGMTTSFSLAAHGRLIASFINQPGGAVLAILTSMVAVASGFTLLTGVSLWMMAAGLFRPSTFILAGAFFALAWVYKIIAVLGYIPGLAAGG